MTPTDKPAESAVEILREYMNREFGWREEHLGELIDAALAELKAKLAAAEAQVAAVRSHRRKLGFADLHGDYYVIRVGELDDRSEEER